ncbi:hypothetical protein [Actinoplanes sp. GCM10030250]|uniref:hypothetical protein n=1 Tax=Actinoplanes sp. GCM10030250 TaxID=3273376 RepID=UPI00360DB849
MFIEIGMMAVKGATTAYRVYRGLSHGDTSPTDADQVLRAANHRGDAQEMAQQDYSPADTGGADDDGGFLDAIGEFFEDLFG